MNRLYGGSFKTTTNYGAWSPGVNALWRDTSGSNLPSSPDFTITEIASYCFNPMDGTKIELAGVIMGRHPQVYGSNFVFGAEYLTQTAGHWLTGTSSGAWHQTSGTVAPGMAIGGGSSLNGMYSEEADMGVHLVPLSAFPSAMGNTWWLWFLGQWVGYIDVVQAGFSLINNSACIAAWYGEAYDPDDGSTNWMNADLGSGLLPSASGFAANVSNRAWIRLPYYDTAINWVSASLLSSPSYMTTDTNCYNGILTNDAGGSNYQPTFFYGGPGGNGAGCM
jgi:hypothetical protein